MTQQKDRYRPPKRGRVRAAVVGVCDARLKLYETGEALDPEALRTAVEASNNLVESIFPEGRYKGVGRRTLERWHTAADERHGEDQRPSYDGYVVLPPAAFQAALQTESREAVA